MADNSAKEVADNLPEQNGAPFQVRVQPWMDACFGAAVAKDATERNHRIGGPIGVWRFMAEWVLSLSRDCQTP